MENTKSYTLLFGATSAMAMAYAEILLKKGRHLVLIGRNKDKLQHLKDHLETLVGRENGKVLSFLFNFQDRNRLKELIKSFSSEGKGIDEVLLAHGVLGDEEKGQREIEEVRRVFEVNFFYSVQIIQEIIPCFKEKKSGRLIVISSVAGLRGKKSNYIYGSSKAALTTYLEGLRCELYPYGVDVYTVLPGFVDTPMTRDFKKGALWALPGGVAKDIERKIAKRKFQFFTPWFWGPIMNIICHLPRKIFVKLGL